MGSGTDSLGTASTTGAYTDVTPAIPPDRRKRRRASGPVALSVLGLWLLSFPESRFAGQKLSDWCFVAGAAAVSVNLLSGNTQRLAPVSMRRTPPLVLVGTLILMSAGALSSLWAVDPIGSMLEVARYGSVTLLWFWLMRTVVDNRETLWRLVRAFKATVLVSCVGGALGLFGILDMNGDPLGPNANRQSAWFGHPNHLAFLLAVGLPYFFLDVPAGAAGSELRRLARRWVPTGIILFFLASTGSMTGTAAAVAGLAVVTVAGQLSQGRRRRRATPKPMAVFIGLAAIPIVAVALLQTGAPLFDRVTELIEGDTSVNVSADSRDRFNDYALDQLGDRLVFGIGLDTGSHELFPAPSSSGANHNMYLTVLVDSGLPGLVGLLIILWWAAKTSWQLVRTTEDPELYALSLALLGSVVAGSVQAYFNPVQHERMYWFAVAMTSVVWALRRHEAQAAGPPQASASSIS